MTEPYKAPFLFLYRHPQNSRFVFGSEKHRAGFEAATLADVQREFLVEGSDPYEGYIILAEGVFLWNIERRDYIRVTSKKWEE